MTLKELDYWQEMKRQRDELLAAALRGVAALEANGAPNCEAAKELRAAIVKATT